MTSIQEFFKNKISERTRLGSLRKLKIGNGGIDFTSNDYLGLADSEDLFREIEIKVESLSHRNGSTGSRLLSGNSKYTEDVEDKLAQIFKAEASLIFNSGYSANLAVMSSIPQKGDTIIYDEFAHACIKDGARLSLAKRFSFRHNDLNDLEKKIKKATGKTFVVVESIYSMDGDECPLKELVLLCERYHCCVILDEAHSTGVVGENGAGLAVKLGLENFIPIRIYTFGKAMGVHGACVAGTVLLKNFLINFARPFIYTTALSPHSVASIDCAFSFLGKNSHLQHQLAVRIEYYLSNVDPGKNKTISRSAIQTLLFTGNEKAKEAANILQKNNLDVRPILSPTVPEGSERLRICLHTFNSEAEINHLTKTIKSLSA